MAQANFSLEKFRNEILSGKGLARTNRFEVLVLPPRGLNGPYELASLYVEQASLPMLNIFTKAFKIFGPSYQMPVTSEYGGEGLPISFHIDRGMKIKEFFEDWMHKVIDPDTFTVSYQEDYVSTIRIRQLDENENLTHEIELIDAFPRNMNLVELNNSSSNQTHRLNVLFAYRYWVRAGGKNPESVPTPIVKPEVPTFDIRLPETRQWNWSTGSQDYDQGSDLPPAA